MKETFGNLTLLTSPLNSNVSNDAFDKKRAALQDHSLLVMNREIVSHERWDEDAIINRGSELFTLAKGLWPVPKAAE